MRAYEGRPSGTVLRKRKSETWSGWCLAARKQREVILTYLLREIGVIT